MKVQELVEILRQQQLRLQQLRPTLGVVKWSLLQVWVTLWIISGTDLGCLAFNTAHQMAGQSTTCPSMINGSIMLTGLVFGMSMTLLWRTWEASSIGQMHGVQRTSKNHGAFTGFC